MKGNEYEKENFKVCNDEHTFFIDNLWCTVHAEKYTGQAIWPS